MSQPQLASADNQELCDLIEELADQLCPAIDGNFGFSIQVSSHHDGIDKLQMLMNLVLDSAYRAVSKLNTTNVELTKLNASFELESAKAKRATAAKSEFLARMSHEIRTPMTAILGFAESLRKRELDEVQAIDAIDTIHSNGQYLLGLINDILDMTKIEAGKLEIEHVSCTPRLIVAETMELMNVRAEAKKISLFADFLGPIPETIVSDPTRLKQILINLVGNAIKFTEKGEVRVIVRTVHNSKDNDSAAEAHNGALLQFDVLDSGIGMTETQTQRLFKPFVQADTSMTRRFGGTGLGLTISKELANLLGGDVTVVYSQPGSGTLFRATVATGSLVGVRMIDPKTVQDFAEPTHAASTQRPDSLLGAKILLAEDGIDNQRLITFVLKKAGADVEVAPDGQHALFKALEAERKGRPYDVILMDMQMPVLDGYQATTALRCCGYLRPIIALTAQAMTGDRETCIKAGCDGYATKPIDRNALIEQLNSQIKKSQLKFPTAIPI
ncbi:MAG TPA: ATP-binding protein [Phycisphaerae bacterium]|nr:ATP-binding protein [Phycisphaerae bacterium]